jgi:hypothetical protein
MLLLGQCSWWWWWAEELFNTKRREGTKKKMSSSGSQIGLAPLRTKGLQEEGEQDSKCIDFLCVLLPFQKKKGRTTYKADYESNVIS